MSLWSGVCTPDHRFGDTKLGVAKRVARAVTFALGAMLVATADLWAQAPASQGQFLPIDQIPRSEQLPAAPLLIAAYVFVWIVALAYVWSIWRRLDRVEREMRDLERRQKSGT